MKQAPQDLFIDMLVDCLTLWQELHVDDSSRIEERNQHELDFGPRLSCFLWPRRRRTLPLKALALGLRVILEDPRLISSDDSLQQVWLSLEMLENVLTHLHAPLLLVIVRSFGTIFAQIFRIPKSSMIIFHTLSRLISSSSAIIRTVNRRSPRTICFTRSTLSAVLLVEGLPLLESSSTSSRPSLNHLCHSKTRERDIVSSPYTSCSIPSASDGVFPSWTKNFRLIRCNASPHISFRGKQHASVTPLQFFLSMQNTTSLSLRGRSLRHLFYKRFLALFFYSRLCQ